MPLTRNRVKRRVRLSIGKRLFCGQLLRRQPATSHRRWSTRYDSYPLEPYAGRGDLITFHNLTVWGFRQEIGSVRQFVVGLSLSNGINLFACRRLNDNPISCHASSTTTPRFQSRRSSRE